MIKVGDIVRVVDPDDNHYNKTGTVACADSKNGIDPNRMPRFGVVLHSDFRFVSYTEYQLEKTHQQEPEVVLKEKNDNSKSKYKVGDKVKINLFGKNYVEPITKVIDHIHGLYYVSTPHGWDILFPESMLSPCDDTDAQKGKQSQLDARYDLIPPTALKTVAEVLGEGEKKYPTIDGVPNWHYITTEDHLNHALAHIYAYLSGADTGEDDLSHAATRLLLALEIDRIGVKQK